MRHLAPALPLPRFRPPALRPCGRLEPLITGPIGANQAARGPIRAGMRAWESPGCSRGAQGAPPRHHPAYSPRSERGSDFKGGRPRRRGDAGATIPPPGPPRPAPPCRAGPAGRPVPIAAVAARLNLRPVGRHARATILAPPHRCRRRLSGPSLRGVPRRTGRPVPLPALAASLNRHSVGCCARAIAFPPSLPLPLAPVWASLREVPRRTDRPVPTAAFAARFNLRSVGFAPGRPPPPCSYRCRWRLVLAFAPWGPRRTDWPACPPAVAAGLNPCLVGRCARPDGRSASPVPSPAVGARSCVLAEACP